MELFNNDYRGCLNAVANGPVGQVLARPLFLNLKTNFIFKKQVINKNTRVIFEFVQFVILQRII